MLIPTFPARFPFSSFPSGIFAVAYSNELQPQKVLPIVFMGGKVVLFRGESGGIGALESYCPHLGADLSRGSVKKDTLQCPFHGLCFNTEGQCSTRGKSGNLYTLKTWQAFEQHGVVFLTYDPQRNTRPINLPKWDTSDWGKLYQYTFKIKSHPQEILENSVDRLHFFKVHGYQNAKIAKPFATHETEFMISYDIERPQGLLPFLKKQKVKFHLNIHAYGLGFSKAEIVIPQYGLTVKQIVMPTPMDHDFVIVRTLTSAKIPERMLFIPTLHLPRFFRKLVGNHLSYLMSKGFLKDFIPDIQIWENKKYIQNPNYLPLDGDFESYRHWASQFYTRSDKNVMPACF